MTILQIKVAIESELQQLATAAMQGDNQKASEHYAAIMALTHKLGGLA